MTAAPAPTPIPMVAALDSPELEGCVSVTGGVSLAGAPEVSVEVAEVAAGAGLDAYISLSGNEMRTLRRCMHAHILVR